MNKESISRFWKEHYSLESHGKGLQQPTPEQVHAHFHEATGLTDIDLDKFKVITASLGTGIRLNKKRKRTQKRYYNVISKRMRTDTVPNETVADTHSSSPPTPDYTTTDTHDINHSSSPTIAIPTPNLIENYLEHQETMQDQARTVSALKEKHTAPSKRKQMFDLLKGKGLYKKFPRKDFKKFESWLRSPSGGQLKCPSEIISEISRFLYFSNSRKIKWKKLLDTKMVNNYLIATKESGLGPDGLKTKIERICTALKYLAYKKTRLHGKCAAARDNYKEWIKPLCKQKKVLRMQHSWRDELCGFKLTMCDLDTAVSKETVDKFMKFMRKAMNNKELTQEEYRVIVDTLITITITQESAIRPGAFQYMTLEELNNPVTHISSDGTIYNIVFVLNHKTFATHGPSAVPFQDTTWIQLHNYLKFVRPQVKPKAPHKQLVFLNANGKMISQPGKAVTKCTKKHEKHITSTKVRHCIATEGNDILTDAERRAIAKGIGHSMQVHDNTYTDKTIKSVKASIEAQKRLHDKSKVNML